MAVLIIPLFNSPTFPPDQQMVDHSVKVTNDNPSHRLYVEYGFGTRTINKASGTYMWLLIW